MDFIKDIELVAIDALDNWKIDHSEALDWDRIVLLYFNKKLMFIDNTPRDVKVSRKIKSSTYKPDITKALAVIEDKFRKGEDVNPHSTRRLYKSKFTDNLFADWNIRHLHLSTGPHPKDERLLDGTSDLLFLRVTNDTAYFIDVRPHGTFEQIDLLEMAVDEWPGLYLWIPDATGVGRQIGITGEIVEIKIETPEEIRDLRENRINVLYMIKGKVYVAPGGGIIPAGTLVNATRLHNALFYWRIDLEKCVNDNRPKIDEYLSQFQNYKPEEASFRVGMNEGEFVFFEETSWVGLSKFEGNGNSHFVWKYL